MTLTTTSCRQMVKSCINQYGEVDFFYTILYLYYSAAEHIGGAASSQWEGVVLD